MSASQGAWLEALLPQLRQQVSSSDEFKMLLHQAAGSMRIVEELLNRVGLLLDSEECCQELANRCECRSCLQVVSVHLQNHEVIERHVSGFSTEQVC